MRDYSQRETDLLAKDLRNAAGQLSYWFQIAHGLKQDPERVRRYVGDDLDYKDIIPRVDTLLNEAEEALPDETPPTENREEELFRRYRDNGFLPEIPEDKSWRNVYSESELIDAERNPDEGQIDYGPLIRAVIDTRYFLLEASKYDEELWDLLPEIEGDDSKIIKETRVTQDREVNLDPILNLLNRTENIDTIAYGFFGEISRES